MPILAGPAPSAEASVLPPAGEGIRVQDHQGIAWRVARSWPVEVLRPLGLDHSDLAQIALAELIRAAQKYDPSRGEWSTYAMSCAKWKVLAVVQRTNAWHTGIVGPSGPEEEEGEGGLDPKAPEWNPLGALADAERREQVLALVRLLPRRYQRVLIWRYGLDGRGERLLEEIGRELGVTKERVRQIASKAIGRLRRLAGGAGKEAPAA